MPKLHQKSLGYLVRFSNRSPLHKNVAYLIAGWLLLFIASPKNRRYRAPLDATGIALAGLVLMVELILIVSLIAWLYPVFFMLGSLSAKELFTGAFLLFSTQRYFVRRAALQTFTSELE